MVIQVEGEHVESLLLHLRLEGFPATRVGEDRVDVLFPASPTLFAAAAELAEWAARTGAGPVVHLVDATAARVSRRRRAGPPS